MKQTVCFLAIVVLILAVPAWAENALEIVDPEEVVTSLPPDPGAPMWDGPRAVLYDNGPFVTHTGTGVGGADESWLQTDLGLNTLGSGHQFLNGYSIADDFDVVDAAGWDVDQITFFAYQTNSPTTSTITGLYVQIWDGPPDSTGTVIWGDLTTNLMASTAWSNAYRVADYDTGVGSARPIMASVATIGGFHLAQGTYWLEWSSDGSASYSGPWAPPISIVGQTTTGNAKQNLDGTWGELTDSGTGTPQGLPFIIEGAVVPVELQSFTIQ
ncbi:MAG: hypothetical protein ABFS37_07180 [Acidobacteriota bacterium]